MSSNIDNNDIIDGSLFISFHRGRNLHRVSKLKMDPYIKTFLSNKLMDTSKICKGGDENPIWEHHIKLSIKQLKGIELLSFSIMNKELISDDKIGEFSVSLNKLIKYQGRRWINLISLQNNNKESIDRGSIEISMEFQSSKTKPSPSITPLSVISTSSIVAQYNPKYLLFCIESYDEAGLYLSSDTDNKTLKWIKGEENKNVENMYYYINDDSHLVHANTGLLVVPAADHKKKHEEGYISSGVVVLSDINNSKVDVNDFLWTISIGAVANDPAAIMKHCNSGWYIGDKGELGRIPKWTKFNYVNNNKFTISIQTNTGNCYLDLDEKNIETNETSLKWNNNTNSTSDNNYFQFDSNGYLYHVLTGFYVHCRNGQLFAIADKSELCKWIIEYNPQLKCIQLKNVQSGLYINIDTNKGINNAIVSIDPINNLIIQYSIGIENYNRNKFPSSFQLEYIHAEKNKENINFHIRSEFNEDKDILEFTVESRSGCKFQYDPYTKRLITIKAFVVGQEWVDSYFYVSGEPNTNQLITKKAYNHHNHHNHWILQSDFGPDYYYHLAANMSIKHIASNKYLGLDSEQSKFIYTNDCKKCWNFRCANDKEHEIRFSFTEKCIHLSNQFVKFWIKFDNKYVYLQYNENKETNSEDKPGNYDKYLSVSTKENVTTNYCYLFRQHRGVGRNKIWGFYYESCNEPGYYISLPDNIKLLHDYEKENSKGILEAKDNCRLVLRKIQNITDDNDDHIRFYVSSSGDDHLFVHDASKLCAIIGNQDKPYLSLTTKADAIAKKQPCSLVYRNHLNNTD